MDPGRFRPVILPPKEGVHDAVIVFLHGSGDSGEGIAAGLISSGMLLPKVKIVCPTAPFRKYTLLGDSGASRVWFDRVALHPSGPEDSEGIQQMAQGLRKLIDSEVQAGVPLSRIVLAGFSMGGCQALCTALGDPELSEGLAGVAALSTFLADDSAVPARVAAAAAASRAAAPPARLPPALLCHGRADSMIPVEWGRQTHARLREAGLSECEWHEFDGMDHELGAAEMATLREWLVRRLPPAAAA